jgi:hypothetical protein
LLKQFKRTPAGAAEALIDDYWTVRAYNVRGGFVFDVDSTQQAVSHPVEVNKHVYGGMTFRGSLAWRENGAWQDAANNNFLTSEGKTRTGGNQTRPRWVDIHGSTGGSVSGVAVMDHPGNFRYPQPVRIHPDKPYFCFAPMTLGPFVIGRDRPLISRYRYFVHDGPVQPAIAERLWQDYAEPVEVVVITGGS